MLEPQAWVKAFLTGVFLGREVMGRGVREWGVDIAPLDLKAVQSN